MKKIIIAVIIAVSIFYACQKEKTNSLINNTLELKAAQQSDFDAATAVGGIGLFCCDILDLNSTVKKEEVCVIADFSPIANRELCLMHTLTQNHLLCL